MKKQKRVSRTWGMEGLEDVIFTLFSEAKRWQRHCLPLSRFLEIVPRSFPNSDRRLFANIASLIDGPATASNAYYQALLQKLASNFRWLVGTTAVERPERWKASCFRFRRSRSIHVPN